MTTDYNGELKEKATKQLRDTTSFLFFDEDENFLCSSFQVIQPEQELASLKTVYQNGREAAILAGVRIQTQRFEVHRYDLPLIYGRTMTGDPEQSESFALCRIENGITGKPMYGAITFTSFCEEHLRAPTL